MQKCGSKISYLLEEVWQQNWQLFKGCKSVAAEMAAC
jgi:hypothetical protein